MRQAGDTNTENPARYTANVGNVDAALKSAAKTVSATYRYHYNNFVPIGPHAAVADVRGNSATVFVQGQSLQGIPPNLGTMLGIPAANVRAIWYEGSSSYGGGMQGEAVEQAAMISQKIGKPVRMQWMRWDQHGFDSLRPGPHVRRHDGRRRERQDRRRRLDELRAGDGSAFDTTKELLGTATWAATPPNGGPNPSDALYRS